MPSSNSRHLLIKGSYPSATLLREDASQIPQPVSKHNIGHTLSAALSCSVQLPVSLCNYCSSLSQHT